MSKYQIRGRKNEKEIGVFGGSANPELQLGCRAIPADEFDKYNKGSKDVNTALRDAEEEIKQLISGVKSE